MEKAFANRTILLDEKRLLFEQKNEKITRQSVKSTMPSNARIKTYDDIVEAEQKRATKVGATAGERGWGRPKSSKPAEGKGSGADELEIGNREIKALALEEYCSVLQF